MRDKRIPYARTVEEEINWLSDLGLNNKEKVVLLIQLMDSCSKIEQAVISETIDAIEAEIYLLGGN
jgi:hypothetical protein